MVYKDGSKYSPEITLEKSGRENVTTQTGIK